MWPDLPLYVAFLLGIAVGIAVLGLYMYHRLKSWKVVKHLVLQAMPVEVPMNASAMLVSLGLPLVCVALIAFAYNRAAIRGTRWP